MILNRILVTAVMLVLGLVGLGMSVCGGGFTVLVLYDALTGRGMEAGWGVLLFSLPFLAMGVLTVVCAWRRIRENG